MKTNMATRKDIILALIEYLTLILSLTGCVLIKIDNKQTKPYMDEIFHIPQVQKYCEGRFTEWDPMITTLPGLYIVSVGILRPISWLFEIPMKVACSTMWLRSINVGFTVCNVYILFLLARKLQENRKDYDEGKALVTAMVLSIFPVLYFFSFLYYTDAGSTFFVLFSYLMHLHGNYVGASIMGGLAILFRQTNIIWVVFLAGLTVADILKDIVRADKKEISEKTLQEFGLIRIILQYFTSLIRANPSGLLIFILKVIKLTWVYILLGLTFIVFVIFNDGIVVGARGDHQVSFNVPQIFYFLSFTTLFSFMHLISVSKIFNFLKFSLQHYFVIILLGVISLAAVHFLTYEHRYLLADNRHYVFYVWSKIYRRHDLVKYALIPAYIYAMWSVQDSLKECDILWKLLFSLCVILNLVPQMLLEFRYFIIPYMIIRLNIPLSSYPKLVLEAALYIAINGLTLYAFMERTFKWPDSSDLQRFMW